MGRWMDLCSAVVFNGKDGVYARAGRLLVGGLWAVEDASQKRSKVYRCITWISFCFWVLTFNTSCSLWDFRFHSRDLFPTEFLYCFDLFDCFTVAISFPSIPLNPPHSVLFII